MKRLEYHMRFKFFYFITLFTVVFLIFYNLLIPIYINEINNFISLRNQILLEED